VQPRRTELALQESVDEEVGVLVVDDGDDQLHAPSIGSARRPYRGGWDTSTIAAIGVDA